MRAFHKTYSKLLDWLRLALLILLVAIFLIVFLFGYVAYSVSLHMMLWLLWSPAGKRVLLVYSNSPVWQSYFEERILPRLPPASVVLNWSERRRWNHWSLAYLAFRFFGGRYEFNPLAVVIRPLRWSKTFRFWRPFRDFKHGKQETLARVEREFFSALGAREPNVAI